MRANCLSCTALKAIDIVNAKQASIDATLGVGQEASERRRIDVYKKRKELDEKERLETEASEKRSTSKSPLLSSQYQSVSAKSARKNS
jgi:hypothetical protein